MANSVPIPLACCSTFSPASVSYLLFSLWLPIPAFIMVLKNHEQNGTEMVFMGTRGVIGDKWSSRILWACAIGSAIGIFYGLLIYVPHNFGLYMVVVERQLQNRERAMADGFKTLDSKAGSGDNV